MPPRLFVDQPLRADETFALPPGPARHVQVLRLQPGDALTLFDGRGGEWSAGVVQMGRSEVRVRVAQHHAVARELPCAVTLAFGMPANDRMDALVEKATELGVATIQPLLCERSVLRVAGDRATKKLEHWRGVAVAASEQCGRTTVPHIAPVAALRDWLRCPAAATGQRQVLSLRDAVPFAAPMGAASMVFLSGPEGGLGEAEENAARDAGFAPVSLGPRVLRADTAPLAVLAALGLTA